MPRSPKHTLPLLFPVAIAAAAAAAVGGGGMAKAGGGMIWATAEDLARSRPVVLSLYRQILRALNSPALPLGHAARLAKKAECRAIFIFAAEERSIHNIRDLLDAARHTLGLLHRGRR
uniref:LYR motif containing domain-containing protein n=1 Tax=Oryza glumipatula TaxID=40148 RepID=A0A0D9YWT9_9ORYZ